MLICQAPELEVWSPDFSSSEQADPTWTRVSLPEGAVTNALNWIEWGDNPVQVLLCEACGFTGCEAGGYVHVPRLGAWLLWTPPQVEAIEPGARSTEPEHRLVRRYGGLAVPDGEWHRWRRRVQDLPKPGHFPRMTGQALADAWRLSVVGPGRASSLAEVVPTLRRNLLHTDTLGREGAIEAVGEVVSRLEAAPGNELRGDLVPPESLGVRLETMYFDGPAVTEWPALALSDGEPLLVLGPDLVFLPER